MSIISKKPILNAPNENLDLNSFRSEITKNGGPARVSRFIINIAPCSLMTNYKDFNRELALMCEATEFPGRGFMTTDIRYYGPSFKAPFHTAYDDIVFSFIVRSDFAERDYFDTWMNAIQPVNQYNFAYRKDYITTVDIYQMADFSGDGTTTSADTGKPQAEYKVTLSEAYPVLMSAQSLVWADENFHRLSITFTFKRWYRDIQEIKTQKFNLIDGVVPILNGGTFIPSNAFFTPG